MDRPLDRQGDPFLFEFLTLLDDSRIVDMCPGGMEERKVRGEVGH